MCICTYVVQPLLGRSGKSVVSGRMLVGVSNCFLVLAVLDLSWHLADLSDLSDLSEMISQSGRGSLQYLDKSYLP